MNKLDKLFGKALLIDWIAIGVPTQFYDRKIIIRIGKN